MDTSGLGGREGSKRGYRHMLWTVPEYTYTDVARVIVVCGVHKHGMGHGWLEDRRAGRRKKAGYRNTSILEHQPPQLPGVVGSHGLCRERG